VKRPKRHVNEASGKVKKRGRREEEGKKAATEKEDREIDYLTSAARKRIRLSIGS